MGTEKAGSMCPGYTDDKLRWSPAGPQPIGLPVRSPSDLCILFHRGQVTFEVSVMMSAYRTPSVLHLLTGWASAVLLGLPPALDSAGDWSFSPRPRSLGSSPATTSRTNSCRPGCGSTTRPSEAPGPGEQLCSPTAGGLPQGTAGPRHPSRGNLQSSNACWSRSWEWSDRRSLGLSDFLSEYLPGPRSPSSCHPGRHRPQPPPHECQDPRGVRLTAGGTPSSVLPLRCFPGGPRSALAVREGCGHGRPWETPGGK